MTRSIALLPLVLLALAAPVNAQEPPPLLSLDEAVALARENNPDHQARLNDGPVADWSVRAAYGRFLPAATLRGGLSYQGGGQARLGGFTSTDIGLGNTPAYYYSSYALGLSLDLSGADLYRVRQQRRARDAVMADLDAAALTLETQVTQQYLATLRARDGVDLASAELERTKVNQELADARYAVEAASAIEAKQAQVERGRAEVGLVQAEATFETEKLRLLTLIGVDLNRDVKLTTKVRLFEPRWDPATLTATALAGHPQLKTAQASLASAESNVGIARTAYWPQLSLSTTWSGYTRRVGSDSYLISQAEDALRSQQLQCAANNEILQRLSPPMDPQNCGTFTLTDSMRSAIVDQNRQFPFNFDREPVSVSLGLSLPIFQGLSRQHQLETARSEAEDARLRVRAEELRVRSEVRISHRNLEAAFQAEQIEERNRSLASDQLKLAQERYRVGIASFVDLMEAEALKANADRAYLLALYAFQEAFTALEAAVGQHLAIPEN